MSGEDFPLTQWTQIERAVRDDPAGRLDLQRVLEAYLPALRYHLVRYKRIEPGTADDLLQGFVATKVLEQHLLARADRARGSRFRTFLLTALDNYVRSQWRHAHRKKRSGAVPLEEAEEQAPAAAPAQRGFEMEWARGAVMRAVERMRRECAASGRPDIWEVFECRILRPAFENAEPTDYEQFVQRFGYTSHMQAYNAVVTAKRAFERALRQTIAEYAGGGREIDEELRDLMAALGGGN